MKGILKGGGAYGLANAGIAGGQFVAVLVFAGALPPDGFGYVSIFAVMTMVLSIVAGMGLSAAAQQSFFKLPLAEFQNLVSAIVAAVLLLMLVLAVVAVVLPSWLLVYLNLSRPWVMLALGAGTAQVLVQLVLTVLQTRELMGTYLAMAALQVTIIFASAGIFYATSSTQWQDALLAQAASPLLCSVLALIVLKRSHCLRRSIDTLRLRQALAYGLPLVPHQLAGWMMSMADRFIIASSLGVAQAGIYSLAFQIAQATNIVSNSFNQALVPVLFQELANKDRRPGVLLRLNGFYAVGLVLFSGTFLVTFLIVAPQLLSPSYAATLACTPWLILAFFLLAASRIASNFLLFHGRTGILALSTLFAAVVSLMVNLWIVPAQGLIGACWTSSATFFILLLVTSWQAATCHLSAR